MRKATIGVVLGLVLSSLLTTRAQTPAADIPSVAFEKFTLPNGLEVIVSESHRLPMVGVNLWYHVGPANEGPGQTGFAHLFEHMMFQGSKHVPGDQHFKLLEGAGASDINGTTDFDRTNYFETVPSNQLELALWMESDRMGYLIDEIDQAQLSNQQDVVRNERRQSYENRPYGIVEEAMFHLLFPPTHPYYANVIGSHADIQAAKLDDVKKFWRVYYSPNNASLAIVGDIDKAAVRKLVEKYFGTLKRRVESLPQVAVQTPAMTSERRAVVQDRVELPRVYMAWLTPPYFKEGDADADIAAGVLGGGRSSRLYKKLVYEKQIAQAVSAGQNSQRLGSIFEIQATARPGHGAAEIEAAMNEELERFRNEGPTAAEIDRARNLSETRTIGSLERLGGFGGVADQLNLYNQYVGRPDYLAQDITRHRAVTPDSVRRFVQQYLKNDARVVVYGVPGTPSLGPEVPETAAQASSPAESETPDEPWRSATPKPAAATAFRFPAPQTFQIANGLRVIYAEQSAVPFVTATLVVRTGSDASPVDRPGLANFTVTMLDQGTATRSSLQLVDDAAQIGASLSASSTMDTSTVGTSSLSRNFPAALKLLADVALHPGFPAEEVERQRAARLANLVQQRANPASVVSTAMALALYGPAHPYGFTELGTPDSNKKITRDELQAFWRQHFVPGNAALVVAGSIPIHELRLLVDATFGKWPRGTSTPVPLGQPTSTKARLVVVDRPGSPQTQVRVASIGAPRSSPDYLPLRVMNEILGGLFSSRINLNLREEHGYTYGAGSQFTFRREAGPFVVSSGVRTDVTAPAVQEILKEIRKMAETSVTPDELALAKDSIMRSLPATFETSARTVGSLSSLFVYGLPLNYYSTLTGQVAAVNAQAVLAVSKKYLVPEKMVVIAVGDRSKIGAALEADLGPAELRDPDGVVVAH